MWILFIFNMQPKRKISEICTLGKWIYVQNKDRPNCRCYLTNFMSSSLLDLYSFPYGPDGFTKVAEISSVCWRETTQPSVALVPPGFRRTSPTGRPGASSSGSELWWTLSPNRTGPRPRSTLSIHK